MARYPAFALGGRPLRGSARKHPLGTWEAINYQIHSHCLKVFLDNGRGVKKQVCGNNQKQAEEQAAFNAVDELKKCIFVVFWCWKKTCS